MDSALIAAVRRFNRTVTQRVGALDDEYMARGRPLGQARLLWEIGPAGAEVAALRARLGLDSGYLSRLLRTLENDGLVAVGPADQTGADGRVRVATLTDAGRTQRAGLDRRRPSRRLDPRTAHRTPPRTTHHRDGRGRTATHRLDGRHRAVPAERPASPRVSAGLRPRHRATIRRRVRHRTEQPGPRRSARPAQRGAPARHPQQRTDRLRRCQLHPDAPAEIKRVWVADTVRGLGVGRRLLGELEGTPPSAARQPSGWTPTATSPRRSPCTGRPVTGRSRRTTPSPTPTTGSRSSWGTDGRTVR